MARRSRRNRRRSRGRFAFLYRLLCFVLICAAIVGALVLFFKVDTISVSGNDRYSREPILAASGVSEGDNLFLLNKYDAAARITEALPYVESVRLSRKLPGTLRIDIVECSDPAGIQQDGHCWLISPEGKLVDSPAEAPNGCPMVTGLPLTDPQVGSLAAVPEEQSGDLARLLELLPVHVSKCRWLPVELPVEPTKPTVCPWRTVSPAETFRWDMWAYSVRVPSGWEITT